MTAKKERLITFQFVLLCLSSFLFFSSFNMMIPELPGYLESLGGGEYKGLIIALFTLTAGLSRPLSGKLTDMWGRVPVMIFGASVCFIIGFIYPIMTSISGFFFLRLVHGFSTGFKPTGTSAYIADIVPSHRRGEAMGIMGISGSLGMSAGPYIGGEITLRISLEAMFYTSSFAALLSILVLIGMKETLANRERLNTKMFKIGRGDIYEPTVLPPSIVMFLTSFAFGVILTLIPDLSEHIGLKNKGTFFLIFTLASILVRFFAGKASDRFGRVAILKISTLLVAFAMFVIAYADSIASLMVSAVFFGLAAGMNSPTIFAWTVDLAPDIHRGRGLSTMFIALEMGIGMGALISGWIYSNEFENLPTAFISAAGLSVVAFIYVQFIYKQPLKRVST